jgi:hypothetical protein
MSSIIIGAATQVSFGSACVVSANWGYSPNTQRFYCIGEWTPRDDLTFYKPTQTLSLTIYSPGPSYDVTPSQSCSDANSVSASVSPAACGGSVEGVSGSWLVTGYNYNKEDKSLPGQESWSLKKWKDVPAPSGGTLVEPTYVLRGISEGQATGNAGITFTGPTTEVSSGSVSAGGFGTANVLEVGVISSVGGGSSNVGDTGQGSASVPYTALYI